MDIFMDPHPAYQLLGARLESVRAKTPGQLGKLTDGKQPRSKENTRGFGQEPHDYWLTKGGHTSILTDTIAEKDKGEWNGHFWLISRGQLVIPRPKWCPTRTRDLLIGVKRPNH
ncbi:unnamed protein product [Dibothriocephalus latus]|uniref:Uncharacterized protein n=1 Tax=Dibothriocephalus latus TaxID=60516 RepID=A0A3P7LG56_DIBLA|nr:unnamed protein product [Dibothriocephalus latus]